MLEIQNKTLLKRIFQKRAASLCRSVCFLKSVKADTQNQQLIVLEYRQRLANREKLKKKFCGDTMD